MKNLLILSGLLLSVYVFAQFPEPKNVVLSYQYIMIGQQCTCGNLNNSNEVSGPTYCSYFSWNKPDTSTTSSHLDGYKVYYHRMYDDSIEVISTLTDTSFYKQIGILGEVWVTAIYSNPAGESSKSNVTSNDNLPISLDKVENAPGNTVIYNKSAQSITLKNIDYNKPVCIIGSNGRLIRKILNNKTFYVSDLIPGLYFIEYADLESKIYRERFIKK